MRAPASARTSTTAQEKLGEKHPESPCEGDSGETAASGRRMLVTQPALPRVAPQRRSRPPRSGQEACSAPSRAEPGRFGGSYSRARVGARASNVVGPGGMKGRSTLALNGVKRVVEQALSERSEDILLNGRERGEGFLKSSCSSVPSFFRAWRRASLRCSRRSFHLLATIDKTYQVNQ